MALDSGTRLGAYEILTLLGVERMGEVYRAKDTKRGRDVALNGERVILTKPRPYRHDATGSDHHC